MPESQLDHAPITWQHLRIILIGASGWFWDVVDINVGSVLSAAFSIKTSPIPPTQLSWLLASTYVGAILGAPLLGWIADRHGRRPALLLTLAIAAASSCAAAMSPTVLWLIVWRTLTGVAIGAFPVILVSYFTEVMPIRERGNLLLFAAAVGAVAWPATLVGAHWLASSPFRVDAWRMLCALAGVGSALTAVPVLRMPESPCWLRSRQQFARAERSERMFLSAVPVFARDAHVPSESGAAAHRGPIKAIQTQHLRPTLLAGLVVLLNCLSPWSTVGFPLLSGAVLVHRGFGVTETLLLTGVGACGCVLGLFVASRRFDSIERRTFLLLCAPSMAAAVVLFAIVSKPVWLIATGLVFTTTAALYIQTLNVYIAEMFPTQRRALGVASGWAVNRLVSVMVPLTLLPLLVSRGAVWMCGVQAGTLLAISALLVISPKGRASRPVL